MKRILIVTAAIICFGGAANAAAFDCSGANYGSGPLGNPIGTSATQTQGSTPGSLISGLAKADRSLTYIESQDGALGSKASQVADKIHQSGANAALPTQVISQCGLGSKGGFPS